MATVMVIRGNKKETLEQVANVNHVKIELLFHDARIKQKNGRKILEPLIKKADLIILMKDACSYRSMWAVRGISKEYNKPIYYQKGVGATGAIMKTREFLKEKEEIFLGIS